MSAINPATLEIIWKRLIAAADEASAAVIRSSFSTSIRESLDFACALTTAKGKLLAQANQAIPAFVGSMPRSVQLLTAMPEFSDLRPGDVVITNDPWIGTGHLPDLTVVAPIFHKGRRVGYAASTAHEIDIGGRASSLEMKDLFEEGLQVPPLKLMSEGRVDETIIAFLRRNVRNPNELLGDLWSQVSALEVIRDRTLRLLEEYQLDDLEDLGEQLFLRSERALQKEIAKIPKGVYRAELRPDSLPVDIVVKMSLHFDGERCHVDFAGSSPQVAGYSVNCGTPYTYAYTAFALKCILAPDIPNNDGIFRRITTSAPEGCCVNPTFPYSGLQRHLIGHHLAGGVMEALSGVASERTVARSGSGPIWYMHQTGLSAEGKPYANMFFFNGGNGGNSRQDGPNALSWPTNISGVPVEFIEYLAPVKMERKALRENSGGAGKHRGGLGLDVAFSITETTPINVTFTGEHSKRGPAGLAGGSAGEVGEALVNGEAVVLNKHYVLKSGDKVVVRTPGGGGWGRAEQRSAAAFAEDEADSYVGRSA